VRSEEKVKAAHFVLYVQDQEKSTKFYAEALGLGPRLNVPGMTEFGLREGCVLGIMPEAGIRRLLGSALPDAPATSAPRAELYLLVEDPGAFHARALRAGARELSPLMERDWGHRAAYSLDPDGYVIAFAESK
jgi:uncharacterized protein